MNPSIPTVSYFIEENQALGLELICQTATCNRSAWWPLDHFAPDDDVISISKKARCTACGKLCATVSVLWRPYRGNGR